MAWYTACSINLSGRGILVGNIIVLPEEVYTKIAAGEVIDGPSAVVRELLDNAIDAGADSIRVTINNGGKDFIQVSDSGCGMSQEDAVLAVRKHTTSKIRRFEDLSKIGSMGFRGEALSSIGAVADFTMITRPKGLTTGTKIICPAGGRCAVEPTASNEGTTVIVQELFRNIPARRKFLKGNRAEAAKVREEVQKKALGFFNIGFHYKSDDRNVFNLEPVKNNYERIGHIYGEALNRSLMEFGEEAEGFRIGGFISGSSMTLPNRRGQYFFINRRPVVHPSLFFAVNASLRGMVPSGRYVYAFVFIDIDPALVDVNVHPAKKEVKIKTIDRLFSLLRSCIDKTAGRHFYEKGPSVHTEESWQGGSISPAGGRPKQLSGGDSGGGFNRVMEPYAPLYQSGDSSGNRYKAEKSGFFTEHNRAGSGSGTPNAEWISSQVSRSVSGLRSIESSGALKKAAEGGEVVYRGCLFRTFLLFEIGDDVILMDQHAAHERVLYEGIRAVSDGGRAVKNLLIPINFTPPASQYGALVEHIDSFRNAGIELEPFGDDSLNVCSMPAYIPERREEEVLALFLEEFYRGGVQPDEAHIRDYFIRLAACRNAVKEGDRLTETQALSLLKDLMNADIPFVCPHGRPTVLYLSKRDLEKQFGRI